MHFRVVGTYESHPKASDLTLRRPNFLGLYVLVLPDQAKTVKVRSDHSENPTNVFGGDKNGNFS